MMAYYVFNTQNDTNIREISSAILNNAIWSTAVIPDITHN